jgi:hypothetical protein
MAKVYENSACTIAAAGAPNSHHGCFPERNPLQLTPCLIAGTVDDGVMAFHNSDFAMFEDSLPLFKRAWVLQEQMPSPRMLYFGSIRGMWWEYRSGGASELDSDRNADPRGVTSGKYNEDFDRMQQFVASPQDSDNDLPEDRTLVQLHWAWFRIVKEYSKRALTKSSDKLIAFSALAHRAQTITGFHYLAGLWKEALIYDLHWCLAFKSRRSPKPTPYRAPTWS